MHGPPDKSEMAKYNIFETPEIRLAGNRNSLKVEPVDGGVPLVRFDFKDHEFGDKHLQFGEKTFTGRTGDEAAEIFAHILVSNPRIKMPE